MNNLQDFFIPAPLDLLLAVFSGLGFYSLALSLNSWIYGKRDSFMLLMCMILLFFINSYVIFLIALSGIFLKVILTIIFYSYVILGLVFLSLNIKKIIRNLSEKYLFFVNSTRSEKLVLILIAVAISGFFLISLSPPSDADSLDYHLGFPIAMLNEGIYNIDKSHLCYHLFGFGEIFNLIGINSGAIQFSTLIQFILFIQLLWAISKLSLNSEFITGFFVVVLCVPVFIFFISGHKHQLTGIVALSASFYYLLSGKISGKFRTDFPFYIAIALSLGIKYSFIFGVVSLLPLLIVQVYRQKVMLKTTFTFFLVVFISLLPLMGYKIFQFGDPFSPLLEGLKLHPEPHILKFNDYLKSAVDVSFQFPLNLLLPRNFGSISTIIGVPVLVAFIGWYSIRTNLAAFLSVSIFILLVSLFGQQSSRFFIEAYIWLIIAFAQNCPRNIWFSRIISLCKVQLLFVSIIVSASAFRLFPGSLTNEKRRQVLAENALGYAESEWINETLPSNSVILTLVRSRSLLSRKSVPNEFIFLTDLSNLNDEKYFEEKVLRTYMPDCIVFPVDSSSLFVKKYAMGLPIMTKQFKLATRNPFNSYSYNLGIYKMKKNYSY